MILSEIEQRIKSKIESIGTPLRDWDISIYRGVLTGYNDAFIIDGETRNELIKADPKSGEVIRPILRGRDIKRYSHLFADRWIINSHNGVREKGIKPININLYPAIKNHLDRYWEQLEPRADQGITPYNLRNCAYIEDFSRQKIVWAELARTGNAFAFDDSGSLLLNTCYILTLPAADSDCLKYILAILNSNVILFYMNLISSKLDNTGWRWLKQFVEVIPIPNGRPEYFRNFSNVVNRVLTARENAEPSGHIEQELNRMTSELFGITKAEMEYIQNSLSSLRRSY